MGRCAPALILSATWALPAMAIAPPPAEPAAAPGASVSAPLLDELRIVGEVPGPALWRVSKGTHVLWVLGTLNHVPQHLQWRSTQVEQALAESQELLPSAPAVSAGLGPFGYLRLYFQWRRTERIPAHGRLQDWLPASLYARFEHLRQQFAPHDTQLETLRPAFAAWTLYRHAIDAAGLSARDDVEASVIAMAQKRHLKIARAAIGVEDPSATLEQVADLPPSVEVHCLDTTVTRLETDLPLMQQRARAWATGDVERLRTLPFPDQREACITALANAPRIQALVAQASWTWLNTAESALDRNAVSFAIQPIYALLASDGPLARFRAEGYRVEGP